MRGEFRFAAGMTATLLLCSCSGSQSALDPQGPHAQQLASLFWIFTAVSAFVWLAVMGVLLAGLARPVPERPDPLVLAPAVERRRLVIVGGAAVATLLTVVALTALSYLSQRQLFARERAGVTIKVTGYQWWWDVRYENDSPERTFTTANEIYVPVGVPVTVKLAANDVIHSFWVPSLMGKLDLIPGQDNEIQFVASRPGVYRGQCAEFCGWQHAHMGLLVIALPSAAFQAWSEAQRAPATAPADAERQRGADLFASKACVMCHTIRGTSAGSRVGPDLTHFGSRKSIASATLPMSRGNIAAWIIDPQGIKPGVNMPNVSIAAEEIDPLVSYLAGLR
jgi:cytochrome c oxidase subunit II